MIANQNFNPKNSILEIDFESLVRALEVRNITKIASKIELFVREEVLIEYWPCTRV